MRTIITPTAGNEKLMQRFLVTNFENKNIIVVPETHNAILISDGQMLQTLSSGKFDLAKLVQVENEGMVVEVLFMSKTAKLKLLWGTTQKFLLYDANIQENYHAGFSGDFEVQISDPRKCYLYLVGSATALTASALQQRLMSSVVSTFESVVERFLDENKLSFNQISVHKSDMAKLTLQELSKALLADYGISVFSFNVANIVMDDEEILRLTKILKTQKSGTFKHCPNCGQKLEAGAKFCSECGTKL